jgi:hypothetical protein
MGVFSRGAATVSAMGPCSLSLTASTPSSRGAAAMANDMGRALLPGFVRGMFVETVTVLRQFCTKGGARSEYPREVPRQKAKRRSDRKN